MGPSNTDRLGDGAEGAVSRAARRRRLAAAVLARQEQPQRTGHGDTADGPVGFWAALTSIAVARAGVSGAGVSVMATVAGALAGRRSFVGATGDTARRLEALQLTTGEGPCLDAFSAGAPVLISALAEEQGRWPGFATEALTLGVAAVFSFPLQIGAIRLGSLDLHRDHPGELAAAGTADTLVLAELGTEFLLEAAPPEPAVSDGDRHAPGDGVGLGWLPDAHAVLHQASGMLAARLGIAVAEALVRIRAHAFTRGIGIDDVARRIVDRTLDLADAQDSAEPPEPS